MQLQLIKVVGIVFASASLISARVITELSIILAKYLPFSQPQVVGFQI